MNECVDFTVWMQENGFNAEQINQCNAKGQSPLILAAQQGRAGLVKTLSAQGADVAAIDDYGNNALWAACFAESLSCIDYLLTAGIDIDYQNPSGASALIYASSSGKHAVVAHLLQAGANPRLVNQDEFSALDLAANRQCLKLLRPFK